MSDDDLRRALHDAVSDVHPRPGLETIRARTSAPTPLHERRRGAWVVLGTVAATAAVIALAAGTGVLGDGDRPEPPTAGSPTPTTPPTAAEDPTGAPAASSTRSVEDGSSPFPGALPVYYSIGTGTAELPLRVVREFRSSRGEDRLQSAISALNEAPQDPDYSTSVHDQALGEVTRDGDSVEIALTSDLWVDLPTDVMNSDEATIAVVQVVRTVRAVLQDPDAQVQFTVDGRPVETAFGVSPAEVDALPTLEVLQHANITTPYQAQVVGGKWLHLSGVANAPEGTWTWKITPVDQPGQELLGGHGQMDGYLDDRLYPFTERVDVSTLPPGEYTVTVTAPSLSENDPEMSDDKQFEIK